MLFAVDVVLNTAIHCGRKMWRILMVKMVLYIVTVFVTVKCSVLGRVVTQTVSSRSSTANDWVHSQASACDLFLEDVTL